ncbi:MAG: sigma-70 family RNA polymerase sigma factor [Deltaproteobacteria bacterium]|nr:sigma-70 family RNA polymerase sigma factor [Deltaproteobacteria bacterium]
MTKSVDSREQFFAALMRRSLAGDEQAYRELLKSLRVILLVYAQGFLMRMGKRDKSAAEDVVQDILTAIHQKRHTYDSELPLLSWVYTIARYKLIDFGRRERKRSGRHATTDVDSLPSKEPLADDGIKAELDKLLAELSEPARRAVELVRMEGHSVEEAAEALAMSPSAVKVSIHRSLKTLNKIWMTSKDS